MRSDRATKTFREKNGSIQATQCAALYVHTLVVADALRDCHEQISLQLYMVLESDSHRHAGHTSRQVILPTAIRASMGRKPARFYQRSRRSEV